MRIGAYHAGYVAVSVVVLAATPGRALVAQGGRTAAHSIGSAAPLPPAASRLEPARGILRSLVGTWRFEVWFAGNFDGAPDASGTRVVTTLFDDLRLQWTEALDRSPIQGQGIIGFDPGSGRFFSTAVYSAGSAPELMTGTLDSAAPLVTFSPIPASSDPSPAERAIQSFALTMLDRNHFASAALDHGWRSVFTRQP
ncbi:MAG TPA: DUF1579 family protein [Gemmatimonadales bacterium]|nr:DUF1579 family protein [Gemmatimonadales bacterium]